MFYECANDEFEAFITLDFYKTAYGTYSDICEVAPALGCAAVNLACGYYKAHTKDEYVVLSEMEASIQAACAILERTTESDKFEYVEDEERSLRYYGGYSNYDYVDAMESYYAQKYYIIEYVNVYGAPEWYDTYARSKAEAVGHFVMDKPNMTYDNIVDVCSQDLYDY